MALIASGQVTVTGAAQPLSATKISPKKWVFKAASSNAAAVEVGPSGVTTATGFVLDPGDDFEIDLTIQQGAVYETTPDQVYVIGASGGVVSWLAFA